MDEKKNDDLSLPNDYVMQLSSLPNDIIQLLLTATIDLMP